MNKYSAVGAVGALGAAAAIYGFSFSKPQLDWFNGFINEDDWLAMPDGKLYHKSCIHHHDSDFKVERVSNSVSIVTSEKEGELYTEELPACSYQPRAMKKEGEVKNLQYYSDWSVYA